MCADWVGEPLGYLVVDTGGDERSIQFSTSSSWAASALGYLVVDAGGDALLAASTEVEPTWDRLFRLS